MRRPSRGPTSSAMGCQPETEGIVCPCPGLSSSLRGRSSNGASIDAYLALYA